MRYRLSCRTEVGWVWSRETLLYSCRTKLEAYRFCGRYSCTSTFMIVTLPKGSKFPEFFKVIGVSEDHE